MKLLVLILVVYITTNAVVTQASETLVASIPDVFPIGCAASELHPPCLSNAKFKKIAVHADLSLKVNIVPLGRLVKDALDGRGDLLFMIEHPALFGATTPIAKSNKITIGFYGNNIDLIHQPLSKKRIPLLRGIPFPDEFMQLGEVIVVPTLNHKQMIGMYVKGRLDAVAGPEIYLRSSMKNFNIDLNNIYEVIPPWTQNVWLYCVKDKCDADLQKRLSEAAKSIQQADVDRILLELGHSVTPASLSEQ